MTVELQPSESLESLLKRFRKEVTRKAASSVTTAGSGGTCPRAKNATDSGRKRSARQGGGCGAVEDARGRGDRRTSQGGNTHQRRREP
jgi:hypothetical protein